MPILLNLKDLPIGIKLATPYPIFGFFLVLIGLSVNSFYADLNNYHQLENDAILQSNVLLKLEANISTMNDELVQLLYFGDTSLAASIQTRAELMQSILLDFSALAIKNGLINDRSLTEEVAPAISELRFTTNQIVSLNLHNDLDAAKALHKEEYTLRSIQIKNFSISTRYGKSDQIEGIHESIKKRELIFITAFIVELFIALITIYALYISVSKQIVGSIDTLRTATMAISKYYSQAGNQTASAENFNQALRLFRHIDSKDQIGLFAKTYLSMINIIDMRSNETHKINKMLIDANSELLETQSQLVQAAKLATVGELATGVAHELNQPLSIIKMNADLHLMSQTAGANSDFEAFCQLSRQQIDRASIIINHLRDFGRDTSSHSHELHNINSIVEDTFILLNEQFRLSEINVDRELEPGLRPIDCNRFQIEQVITNLLMNAKDAMENAYPKNITIRTFQQQSAIIVEVNDSGEGIPAMDIDRIFDPFWTSKEVGKGTGLGLSISYGIVKKHGGDLSARNGVERGAVFRMELPFTIQSDNKY